MRVLGSQLPHLWPLASKEDREICDYFFSSFIFFPSTCLIVCFCFLLLSLISTDRYTPSHTPCLNPDAHRRKACCHTGSGLEHPPQANTYQDQSSDRSKDKILTSAASSIHWLNTIRLSNSLVGPPFGARQPCYKALPTSLKSACNIALLVAILQRIHHRIASSSVSESRAGRSGRTGTNDPSGAHKQRTIAQPCRSKLVCARRTACRNLTETIPSVVTSEDFCLDSS